MTELEKVEKLREKANVSFAEAKEALDSTGGDILEALILLENQGKATVPAGGGFFSGAANDSHGQYGHGGGAYSASRGETFSSMMKRFGRFCLLVFNKGNTNFLEAHKGGEHMFSCPVTVLVVLLIFFFWVTVPLFVLSLFMGLRYKFRGDDLGRDSVNSVMDNASNVVDDVKKTIKEGRNNNAESSDNT